MQQRRLNQEEQEDHADDNPALSQVIEWNIRTIIQLRLKAARARSVQDHLADAITVFSGRMVCVYVYIVWFGVWLVLNTRRVGVRPFDEESIDQDQRNTSEHGYSVEHVHLMARSCGPLRSAVGRRPLLGAISWSGAQ